MYWHVKINPMLYKLKIFYVWFNTLFKSLIWHNEVGVGGISLFIVILFSKDQNITYKILRRNGLAWGKQ